MTLSPLIAFLLSVPLPFLAGVQQPTPAVEFSIAAQQTGEGAAEARIEIVIDAEQSLDVIVPFSLSGTALTPEDYSIAAPASQGQVTLAAGQTSAVLTVTLVDDALFEADEDVVVTLGMPTNAGLGAIDTHTLTILDNDPAPVVDFALASGAHDEGAGSVLVTVSLDAVCGVDIPVPFSNAGTASEGVDYTLSPLELTIPAGQASADIAVTIIDDPLAEGVETVTIDLGAAGLATVGAIDRHVLIILASDLGLGSMGMPAGTTLPLTLQPHDALDCGSARVGENAAARTLTVTNHTQADVSLTGANVIGSRTAADFSLQASSALPILLAPGAGTTIDVIFQPSSQGLRKAKIALEQVPYSLVPLEIDVTATGFGPTGSEILINCGGARYIGESLETWAADHGFTGNTSTLSNVYGPVSASADAHLYRSARVGFCTYGFDLPDGEYDVTLHFAELIKNGPGQRVFDVSIEGALAIGALDVFAVTGSMNTAYSSTHRATVADGRLDIVLTGLIDGAIVNAIEVRSVGIFQASPQTLDFGVLNIGQSASQPLTLSNVGLHSLRVDSMEMEVVGGTGGDFTVDIGGTLYQGSSFTVTHPINVPLGGGEALVAQVTYAPQVHSFNDVHLRFTGDFEGSFEVHAHGNSGVGGHPFLHPVIGVASTSVDYDLSGGEDVFLDGSDSHTHESGHVLTAWEWRENAALLSSLEQDTLHFPTGPHTVELTIYDDHTPPESLATSAAFEVVPVNAVPGVLARYYFANPPTTMARDLLDNVPANPDFAELFSNLHVATNNGVGGSGRSGDVMVRLNARFDVAAADSYDFHASGGVEHRIELDGVPFSGPIALSVGTHDLEIRWAVDSTAELPLDVQVSIGGSAFAAFDPGQLTHDQRTTPVINSMPAQGITQGGNQIVISGFAFFPRDQVKVLWGSTVLTEVDFTSWSAESIEFPSPAGSPGFITVTVETPYGTSNPRQFEYTFSGPIPVLFAEGPKPGVTQPTALDWGPDGRLWVASRKGTIHAFEFNDDYSLKAVENFSGVSSLTNREIMGLAFNPYDAPGPIKVYVVHTEMYAQGGGAFVGPSPYPGQVSLLTEPDFDNPTLLIDGLPTSNHDHGTNGMVFDNNGDLLICVGGNTNAGVIWPTIGNLPESPLSGAIIKARTSRPGFNGSITYIESGTQTPNDDQVFGDIVEVAPGIDVSVQAAGLRNSFDLAYTTWGMLYATDNGPNMTWGPASTGPSSQTSYDPYDFDELLLVEYDHYYGHPNRNRGRYDPIQNVYMDSSAPVQAGFTQALTLLPSSTNGITEYRADTFGGAMRGELLALKLNGQAKRIRLGPGKRTVLSSTTLATLLKGLDLRSAPGGALISTDYNGGKIRTFIPVDAGVSGLTVYDIFPWRAPAGGGMPFVIGGANFGSLADTSVSIDGIDCPLSSVSPKRIRGVLPAHAQASSGLVDVTVTVAGVPKALTKAFQVLPSGIAKWQGTWEQAPSMPVPIGEVAAGAIAGKLYVIGEFSGKTLAFDTLTQTWSDTIAKRPLQGHHHAAEVYQGKLYVIGGLNGGSPGQVQIYDPLSDTWSAGAPMPWSAGSVSTALIAGKIYAAGGIVGNTTVDDCAEYDIASDTWTSKAPMPIGQGRNHAAAASDGQRMFIFGGRGLGSGAANVVANGFPDVQIYDPATDTWTTSLDPGSTLTPMPIGRGGTGKAVFYRGEFHVFGGETLTGPGAQPGNVYDRVDVYDPLTNTWRLERPMPTPRHGIFPVYMHGKIYVAGGGTNAGSSSSAVLEIYSRQ